MNLKSKLNRLTCKVCDLDDHIYVDTVPNVWSPNKTYFIKSTGRIVRTDTQGNPIQYGGGELPIKARVVPVKQVSANYTPMSYSYDYADLTELNPSTYRTRYAAFWMNFGDTYSRIVIYYYKPERLDKILFKNIGNYRCDGLEAHKKGVKSGIIWGITDPNDIPVGCQRRIPIPSGVKLYEGEFDRITNDNWYELQEIPISYDGLVYGLAFDVVEKFDDNSDNRIAIQKLISIKK